MNRKPFQGVITIVRFNWHLFAAALAGFCILFIGAFFLSGPGALILRGIALLTGLSLSGSLAASYHAYDTSGLYRLDWLEPFFQKAQQVANIHAGFDETSALIKKRFPQVNLQIFDFYDPERHTEISLRRARAACPPAPDTISISSVALPAPDGAFDHVLLMLAAHEIRDREERVCFFAELRRALAPGGRIILVEHLRDLPNLVAYNLGAWHFHTRREWLCNIAAAGLAVFGEHKLNGLVTCLVIGRA